MSHTPGPLATPPYPRLPGMTPAGTPSAARTPVPTAGTPATPGTPGAPGEPAKTEALAFKEDAAVPGDTLAFPAGFGSIYLGETFTAFVSACNNSTMSLTRLEVRAEIQTGSKRLPLLEGQAGALLAELAPKQQADFVVEHELKEAGVHIMICSASYLDAACEERKVRQYFKFQVQKPLSVTTKLHVMRDAVFLENQIQNQTRAPLLLARVAFAPSAHYTLTDLSDFAPAAPAAARPPGAPAAAEGADEEALGAECHLRPGDVRQLLYRLAPAGGGRLDPADPRGEELGRLEMAWRTLLGEPGRLHSVVSLQQLTRRGAQWKLPPAPEVSLAVASLPDRVALESPFPLALRLRNASARPRRLALALRMGLGGALVQCGVCEQRARVVQPGEEVLLSVELMALAEGLQALALQDVAAFDVDARESFPLAHDVHVLVTRPDA